VLPLRKNAHQQRQVLKPICVVVCCSVLQCVAVCCTVLHCVALCCNVLQCVAVYCSVSQCVAACCSALQRVLPLRRNAHPQHQVLEPICSAVCCSVLHCVVVCCSVLQSVTMRAAAAETEPPTMPGTRTNTATTWTRGRMGWLRLVGSLKL